MRREFQRSSPSFSPQLTRNPLDEKNVHYCNYTSSFLHARKFESSAASDFRAQEDENKVVSATTTTIARAVSGW